jgi:hypothetical protein
MTTVSNQELVTRIHQQYAQLDAFPAAALRSPRG